MSNVHIEQGQCVLPSHLFWWQLGLSGKIFQGDIISPHHHILRAYVMAPSFETMYHNPYFLFMCSPPLLYFAQLFVLKCHWPSILHYNFFDRKVRDIRMDLKIFVKVSQLLHKHFHQNAFQGFKGLITCFIPFISFRWLFQKVCQRCGYFCKILDELAIIRSQSLKWF